MGIPKESDDGGKRSRKEENKSRGKTREGKNKDYGFLRMDKEGIFEGWKVLKVNL